MCFGDKAQCFVMKHELLNQQLRQYLWTREKMKRKLQERTSKHNLY